MKSKRWFNRIHFLTNLRIASAVTLMSGAAALAFVAATNNMLTTGNGSPGTTTHRLMKQQAQYGLASRN